MRNGRGKWRKRREFSCLASSLDYERILIGEQNLLLCFPGLEYYYIVDRSYVQCDRMSTRTRIRKKPQRPCCSSVIYLNRKKWWLREKKEGRGRSYIPRSCPGRVIFFNVHDSTKIAMIIFRRIVHGPPPSSPLLPSSAFMDENDSVISIKDRCLRDVGKLDGCFFFLLTYTIFLTTNLTEESNIYF